MASGWPLWGTVWWWGQAVVSRVLHIPLSSFPSALCITNQKGALRADRLTAQHFHFSVSFDCQAFWWWKPEMSHYTFLLSSLCFATGEKTPAGFSPANQSHPGTLTEAREDMCRCWKLWEMFMWGHWGAALSSNRAILSAANIRSCSLIFCRSYHVSTGKFWIAIFWNIHCGMGGTHTCFKVIQRLSHSLPFWETLPDLTSQKRDDSRHWAANSSDDSWGVSLPGLRAIGQGVEFSAWGFYIHYAIYAKDNGKGSYS